MYASARQNCPFVGSTRSTTATIGHANTMAVEPSANRNDKDCRAGRLDESIAATRQLLSSRKKLARIAEGCMEVLDRDAISIAWDDFVTCVECEPSACLTKISKSR